MKRFENTHMAWLQNQIIGKELPETCMLWPFSRQKQGYGKLKIPDTGRTEFAHRVAFEIMYGHMPTPQGLHSCDTPACFNPKHVVEGDQTANLADMRRKGRQPNLKGEKNGAAILTPELVRQIRSEYVKFSRSHGSYGLARRYGVCQQAIHDIVTGKHWSHV